MNMRLHAPRPSGGHDLRRLLSIGILLVSTSAFALPPPAASSILERVRPASGSTIPATPNIWLSFDYDDGALFTGTFFDEGGNVLANATVSPAFPQPQWGERVKSVTADARLPAGTTVELVLQNPFGDLEEERLTFDVEETPRPNVVLPLLQVDRVEVTLDGGELFARFTAGLDPEDLSDDVQGFIIAGAVEVGEVAGEDRIRTSTLVKLHPELDVLGRDVRTTMRERLEDQKPTEVCVSLGAYTVSNVEIPVSLVPAEMDCYPVDLDDARWEALVANRDAARIRRPAEPDPFPPLLEPYFGCSQSDAPATAPFALLGILCFAFAFALRRRRA